MSGDLLPCPFCGGEPTCNWESHDASPPTRVSVDCETCGASVGLWTDHEDLVRAAWNRRASGWIAVDERLPKLREVVLTQERMAGFNRISVGYLTSVKNGVSYWITEAYAEVGQQDITYWKPLPEAAADEPVGRAPREGGEAS